MAGYVQGFISRQQMLASDFEYFHFRDEVPMEVEYHNHDFYEVYFFISGRVTYNIEGKSYRLKNGDILLISNKELHKPVIEEGEPYERIVIWINPDFVKRIGRGSGRLDACFEDSSYNKHNLMRPGMELMSRIKESLGKFEKAYNSTAFGSEVLREAYLAELLVFLNRAFAGAREDEQELDIELSEKIMDLIKYINDNISGDLSLDILAARFYLSKYHLLREFKKHSGFTIHHYIQQKRLIMARELLKDDIPVTEVCERCGFEDYSNFIRSFKKAFGISPKKYFKQVQELRE